MADAHAHLEGALAVLVELAGEVVDGIETVRLFNYEEIEDGASVSAADYEPLTDGAILIVPERGFLE